MDSKLTALAVVPGLLILIYVYTKDKVEKEPILLIVKLIIFGAISAIVAGYAESFADQLLPYYEKNTLNYALKNAFLLAGFWEELLKLFFLKIGSWKHHAFNYRFDGIVYGASVAVGFAILENIMYVADYGFTTGVVRAFTAVPLHAFCGITMG
ncbi:MAG: PrsW family intramembrane metalloprotease, partial [Oscillospiraceae bacterium]|nr:PrsW family intramembrane metalloprotease [Oscillospiraceae bacterium]